MQEQRADAQVSAVVACSWRLRIVRQVPSEERSVAHAAHDEVRVGRYHFRHVDLLGLKLRASYQLTICADGVRAYFLLTGGKHYLVVASLEEKDVS